MSTERHPASRRLAEPDVARVIGVRPVWLGPLMKYRRLPAPVGSHLGHRAWDQDEVKRWLYQDDPRQPRRVSESPHTLETVRWLVLRLGPRFSVDAISRTTEVHRSVVDRRTALAALRLVRAVPHQVQQEWATARAGGGSDAEIATRYGVGTTLVRPSLAIRRA